MTGNPVPLPLVFIFAAPVFVPILWITLHIIRWWVFRHPRVRHALAKTSGIFLVIAAIGMLGYVVSLLGASVIPMPSQHFSISDHRSDRYVNGFVFAASIIVSAVFFFSAVLLTLVSQDARNSQRRGRFPLRWRLKALRHLVRFNRPSWKKLERRGRMNRGAGRHWDNG